jgi:choline dehydrogenase-like flavoprotein
MEIKEQAKTYDAVVVGSGAGGGMTAKVLSEAGLRVAVIEAGPHFDPAHPEQRIQLRWPWESPRRGASTKRFFGDFDAAYGGMKLTESHTPRAMALSSNGLDQECWEEEPTIGKDFPALWPKDFKRKDQDGLGDNWPISYEDVKPYYDKVDKLIGVFGSKEGIPNEPDGFFLPAPKPRLHELYYIKGARKANIPVIPARMSILTKMINDDRGVCFYCSQCNRGCTARADFSSGTCLIFPAMKNGGQIDLFVNSMVREVITNENGKATGVSYINKEDRKEYQVNGKTVVLAASACSSARILLNSKSKQHPNGLGNSSGILGHYLHDSTGSSRAAFMPDLMNRKIYNEDGVGGMHVYSPWWGNNKQLDFPRGYHLEIWGGMGMPSYGFGFNVNDFNRFFGLTVGGYGNSLRKDVKKYYGAMVGISARGESIPMKDNYCDIDPNVVDEWGIPVLRFNYRWSDYERRQARHMHQTFDKLFEAMGAKPLSEAPGKDKDYGLADPGYIIHEVGTARMGNDPGTSVTNKFQQLHDADNVFVCDGGSFVSQADKNPTWTILALAWRTSEYILDQLKQRNI